MNKSAVIRARVAPEVKTNVEKVFVKLGISTSEAINMFCSQVLLHKGLPFQVKIPNKATKEAMDEARKMKGKARFNSADEMFDELGL